ncbi:MAG: M23 family metallopeptidase [Calditrichota bacterium]
MKTLLLVFASLLWIVSGRAEELLWPLPDSRTITGGFADSRPDHFHGGVDVRAQSPLPVVAPADGWVERFAVSPTGYGRTVYFRMSDGRTAVFGHLSRFEPRLEQMLRDSQLVIGTYRVDCSFVSASPERSYHRGETVAFTGHTGIGPSHFHFEIREGAVQTDPLANYNPRDTQPPVISHLWWTPLSKFTPFDHGTEVRVNKGVADQAIQVDEPLAFFIQTYDPGPWGRHAVPSVIRMRVRNEIVYEYYPTRVDLLGPRDIYSGIVWSDRRRSDLDIRRIFAVPPPSAYQDSLRDAFGWLSKLSGDTVFIEVEDRAGSITTAAIPVTAGAWKATPASSCPDSLQVGRFRLDCSGDVSAAWATFEFLNSREVEIGPTDFAFGDRHRLTYEMADDEALPGLYFYELKSHGARRPLWRNPDEESSRRMSCSILRAGTYGIAEDHEPPRLLISARSGKITFDLRDSESGIDDSVVRCRVDGKTAIAEFEYEEHGGAIWTSETLSRGLHEVVFEAADRAGNAKTWTVSTTIH